MTGLPSLRVRLRAPRCGRLLWSVQGLAVCIASLAVPLRAQEPTRPDVADATAPAEASVDPTAGQASAIDTPQGPAAVEDSAAVDAQESGTDPGARQQSERTARVALESVRTQQQALTRAQESGRSAQAEALHATRAADLALADEAGRAHALTTRVARLDQELRELEQQAGDLEARLAQQRAVVAALLRSAHALGRHQQLRTLLGSERNSEVRRLLAYHQAIERDRSARLRRIAADLDALAANQRAVASNRERWSVAARSQKQAVAARERARDLRREVLANAGQSLASVAERMQMLHRDEKGLLELIARLTDAIADVARDLESVVPMSKLKGTLPWPVKGKVLSAFGVAQSTGEPADGLLIEAATGAEVDAIAHGRVAYADWLKGYGLVLIIDHGEGFMSLYAQNETLLSEVGDWVAGGEPIATAGASGGRRQAGVWFELRRNGQPQNPAQWLARR